MNTPMGVKLHAFISRDDATSNSGCVVALSPLLLLFLFLFSQAYINNNNIACGECTSKWHVKIQSIGEVIA